MSFEEVTGPVGEGAVAVRPVPVRVERVARIELLEFELWNRTRDDLGATLCGIGFHGSVAVGAVAARAVAVPVHVHVPVGATPPLTARPASAVDPAHATDSTSGRSTIHSGWNTCHCSGARRIISSIRWAISCVSRSTSSRSVPQRLVSIGGSMTAR